MQPLQVTVWSGWWNGGTIDPYCFENEDGETIMVNRATYHIMSNDFFPPALHGTDMNDVGFHQDGTTCQTYHATIDLLCQMFDWRLISHNGYVNCPLRSYDFTTL